MNRTFIALFGLAMVSVGAFMLGIQSNVPVTEEPKQSPYAVIIEVCNVPEYILVTTNPPIGQNRRAPAPTPGLDEALQNVPPERVLILKHWDAFCPKPKPKLKT